MQVIRSRDDRSSDVGKVETSEPRHWAGLYDPENAPQVPGRREFFTYIDLGVTAASQGRMRAQLTRATSGMTQPTGWHYHTCKSQFVYALRGWVDLEFEDGTKVRVKAGDSIFIPGGLRHNETATSDDLQILEFSVPADMGLSLATRLPT